MASWIVHLRIAEELLAKIGGFDADQFGIGNVAPDSGVPDENWETFDPPPQITHYQPKAPGQGFRCEDLRFYRENLANIKWPGDDNKRFSFLLGYFFHLIVDNLWWVWIVIPTQEKYAAEFEADDKFIWEVKKDWYGLDFVYVRAHRESFFWRVFLKSEYTKTYLDYFPWEAIPNQLEYIKSFYQREDEEVEKKLRLTGNIYLTSSDMDEFVERAVQTLYDVYQLIWEKGIEIKGKASVLEAVGY